MSHSLLSLPQALLAVYFFLSGLLVKGHPWMWLLPLVSCVCAMTHLMLDKMSFMCLPFYRQGGGWMG